MNDVFSLTPLLQQFAIDGSLLEVQELKVGHIHDTYCSVWNGTEGKQYFIHQKLNTTVFPDIDILMDSIQRVCTHIQKSIDKEQARDEICTVVKTKSAALYAIDEDGSPWRTYTSILDSQSYQVCPSVEVAREAAACCGRFQRYVADCSPEDFPETIVDFHSASHRYQQLNTAITQDRNQRKLGVAEEIEFVLERQKTYSAISDSLKNGSLPRWLTHNDLKLNNVLFRGDHAISLVDLDTYMPGSPLLDFGDLVRVASTDAREDEQDLSRVSFNISFYKALAEGYWSELQGLLQDQEWQLMPIAPATMTLIIGVRFLTDYLNGDVYFKTEYPEHNLTRARVQFALVKHMEQQESVMRNIRDDILAQEMCGAR